MLLPLALLSLLESVLVELVRSAEDFPELVLSVGVSTDSVVTLFDSSFCITFWGLLAASCLELLSLL